MKLGKCWVVMLSALCEVELAANTSVLTALKILCFESLLEYQQNGSLG